MLLLITITLKKIVLFFYPLRTTQEALPLLGCAEIHWLHFDHALEIRPKKKRMLALFAATLAGVLLAVFLSRFVFFVKVAYDKGGRAMPTLPVYTWYVCGCLCVCVCVCVFVC